MSHPLYDDAKNLTENELSEKIATLSKKYWQTNNSEVKSQILLILDDLKEEQRLRIQKSMQNSLDDDNKDLDNLINIS